MSLDTNHPGLRSLLERLAPYARSLLGRAGDHALRLHADVVSREHLLAVLMDDPESAAHQLVLHAFADPETIAEEALAISPGVMVVASSATLPFSPLGLRALQRARELAIEQGADEIAVDALLAGATEWLQEDARAALAAVDESGEAGDAIGAEHDTARTSTGSPTRSPSAIAPDGPLFKFFSMDAKRSLAAAGRGASQLGQTSISPAQVVIGCLRTATTLAERSGLTWQRARLLLGGHTLDETAPEPRLLPPDEELVGLLSGLDEGATSLGLLRAVLVGGAPELAEILTRQKVSETLLERAQGAFQDPDPAP